MELGFHGDTLLHRERTFELVDQPLEMYFDLIGSRPTFDAEGSAERGYTAQWTIEDGWLFLVNIQARWSDAEALSIKHLFPFAGNRVFAAWYHGQLRAFRRDRPLPNLSDPARRPYPDLTLSIEHGRIASATLIERFANSPTASAVRRPTPAEVLALDDYRKPSVHAAFEDLMI
ncbi:MAG: hypothetical protein R3E87_07780 [Burkholderiaceae bacterium]